MRNALKYGAVLIGSYLVLAYATGFGKAVGSAGGAAVNVTKALQGR